MRGIRGAAAVLIALAPALLMARPVGDGRVTIVGSGPHSPLAVPEKGLGFRFTGPGRVLVSWPRPRESPWIRVRLSDPHGLVFKTWTTGRNLHLRIDPGTYRLDVAESGRPLMTSSLVIPKKGAACASLFPTRPTPGRTLSFSWFPIPHLPDYLFQLRSANGEMLRSQRVLGSEFTDTLLPGRYEWRATPSFPGADPAVLGDWTAFAVVPDLPAREDVLGHAPHVATTRGGVGLHLPEDAIEAPDGTIYISDTHAGVIRSVRGDRVELFAGTLVHGYNGDGYRTRVQFNKPTTLLLDRESNVLVIDSENCLLRRIDPRTGQVSTVAGIPGQPKLPPDGATARSSPIGLCDRLRKDRQGNFWMISRELLDSQRRDYSDQVLLVLTEGGLIHRRPLPSPELGDSVRDFWVGDGFMDFIHAAGLTRVYGDGSTRSASLPARHGGGMEFDPATQQMILGNGSHVYRLDRTLQRRRFLSGLANVTSVRRSRRGYLITDSDGEVVLEADSRGRILRDDVIGSGDAFRFRGIVRCSRFDQENLLLLDSSSPRLLLHAPRTGRTRVFAGDGLRSRAALEVDKEATGFWYPAGLAADHRGNVFVAEEHRVIKIDREGKTSLYSGSAESGDMGDRVPAGEARYRSIRGLACDAEGSLFVADTYNSRVKKISPEGLVTVVAGIGTPGIPRFVGPATAEALNHPQEILPAADGTLLISDTWNNSIVRVERDGRLSPLAGIPSGGTYQGQGGWEGDGGPATRARLNTPVGLALGTDGSLYIADSFNHRIRKVSRSGVISTVWGGDQGYASDGRFLNFPCGLAVMDGYLYVADTGNGLVSRFLLSALPSESAPK